MDLQLQREIASNLGNFPFIWYGKYQFEVQDIDFFSIYYVKSIPHMKLVFYDSFNLLKDKNMPMDDTPIKVFLNPRSSQLKEILMQFKILNFTLSGNKYYIDGIIDNDDLHVAKYRSYSNKTSFEVLQDVCKEAGLGFNTNIDGTNDKMTWINAGDHVRDFLEEVVDTSYKSDDSYLCSFLDFYYNFNFVDLQKELERDNESDLGISDISILKSLDPNKEETLQKLILSNDDSFRESNLFFETYTVLNNSTDVSLNSGYRNIVKYYDVLNKDFLVFNVDSITSQENDSIILKGAPQDDQFYKKNIKTDYLGKMDIDNVHSNYNYAYLHNKKNITDLSKFGLEIVMTTPNFSIYRFLKVKVFISNQTSTPTASLKNDRLSGDWLITDISYVFSNGKMRQVLTLIKRELSLSDEELAAEAPINTTDTSTNFEKDKSTSTNPEVSLNEPNPVVPPAGNTSSVSNVANAEPEITGVRAILDKELFRQIYRSKIKPQLIELMYEPLVTSMEKFEINTVERICAYLSQVNTETVYLKYSTEIDTDFTKYNNNSNLGNGPNDGIKYKGRGLLSIVGKNRYKSAGDFLQKDFILNPGSVAAENSVHNVAADTTEQVNNSVNTSIWYWLKGSSFGNLNSYADKMSVKQPIDLGVFVPSQIPNDNQTALNAGFQINKNNNFATQAKSINPNLLNYTYICFGIKGGYDGYKDRIDNWNYLRKFFT